MNKSILILIFLLVSCSRTYRVPNKYLKLIPYKQGDEIVFESNNGMRDTLFIEEINRYIGPNDPLGFNSDKEEVYDVLAKIDSSNLFVLKLITLKATEKEGVIFTIRLSTKHSSFYGPYSFDMLALERKHVLEQSIGEKIYSDIWVFDATDREYEDRDDFVERIYWSKSEGFVKYEKANGEIWEIIQ